MNTTRCIWVSGFLLLAGLALPGTVWAENTATRPQSSDVAALVRRLGSDDFKVREEASRLLMKIGLPARDALLQGAKDDDLEIRRRCRDLIPAIEEAHRQAKLNAFIADKEGKHKHDLPGWERYRKLIGDDAASRQFFVAIQKADTGFLAEVEKDPEGAGPRCANLCQTLINRQRGALFVNGGRNIEARMEELPPAEIAPLLLVAADPKVTIPLKDRYLFGNLLYQAVVRKELQRADSTPFKKIVLCWMERQAGDEMTAQILFDTVNSLQLKEGLPLALKAIREKKLRGSGAAHALVTIGRLGDKRHLEVLESFLDDKTQICGFGIGRAGGNIQGNTEVRDVALAMLVRQTKQSFKDYGFAIGGLKGFDHLMNNANYMGFSSSKERDKAFAKWKAWKASQKK